MHSRPTWLTAWTVMVVCAVIDKPADGECTYGPLHIEISALPRLTTSQGLRVIVNQLTT